MGQGVETIYGLYEGEETIREVFHGLPRECVLAGLRILEGERKAEIIGVMSEDAEDGVKFF